eukprot:CAMPEP_0174260760 /NCGR_PEP_ID=MMETSP0439-20130205/10444_1 /TAXON_ID=0 /ORGANISM="Stereomyxa ramosa, Strain Chinc5" /LENGTH=973 /DNA_ID=CAMNT_0015345079 /DNA_START=20 /DNA_END=2941 /DNA_ORIENTATION=+
MEDNGGSQLQGDDNLSPKELERRLKDRKWEQVQIKGLSGWLNSYLVKNGIDAIKQFPEDLSDGVKILQFLEIFSRETWEKEQKEKKKAKEEQKLQKEKTESDSDDEGKEKGSDSESEEEEYVFPVKYIRNPKNRIEKMENGHKAINYIKNELNVRIVGVGAEDIVDGQVMLILGLLWSSFRTLSFGRLSEQFGDKSKGKRAKPEDDLCNWIETLISHHGDLKVEDFKTSFNDGLVWAAMIDRFDPDFIDFETLRNENDPVKTLETVFEVAEKKLGIPKLFDVSDLVDGTPDERSVVLYSSLFYHAWITNEERIKIANANRNFSSAMEDVEEKLKHEEEERLQLEKAKSDLEKVSKESHKTLDDTRKRIKELEEAIQGLTDEKNELSKKIEMEIVERKRKLKERIENATGDLETLGDEVEEISNNLSEEREKKEKTGRKNAELLAQNIELRRQLKQMRGNKLDAGALLGCGLDDDSIISPGDVGTMAALLREHVSALHCQFKAMQDKEENKEEKQAIQNDRRTIATRMQKRVEGVKGHKNAEELEEYLSESLQQAGRTMIHILNVKDSVNELNEIVDKKGYLMAQVEGRRWKKRWFVLRGLYLYYYNRKEEEDDVAGAEGEINLENSIVKSEDSEGKPKWTIRITVTDFEDASSGSSREELIIGTKTMEDRDDWLCLLRGKSLYLSYLNLMQQSKLRPDGRFITLCQSRNIGSLELDYRPLSLPVIKMLSDVLESHSETESISLAGCDLDDDCLACIGEFLQRMPELLSLNLSRNKFTARGLAALAEGLSDHSSLEQLNLSSCGICDDGLESICSIIEQNKELDVLNLSGNEIVGDDSSEMSRLAAAIGKTGLLSVLKLNNNKLGDNAAQELAQNITQHPGIIEIKLQNNQIGDAGAIALFDALHDNDIVKKVDLSTNKIATKGLAALKTLLESNTVLEKVDLSSNPSIIGDEELKTLAEIPDVSLAGLSICKK